MQPSWSFWINGVVAVVKYWRQRMWSVFGDILMLFPCWGCGLLVDRHLALHCSLFVRHPCLVLPLPTIPSPLPLQALAVNVQLSFFHCFPATFGCSCIKSNWAENICRATEEWEKWWQDDPQMDFYELPFLAEDLLHVRSWDLSLSKGCSCKMAAINMTLLSHPASCPFCQQELSNWNVECCSCFMLPSNHAWNFSLWASLTINFVLRTITAWYICALEFCIFWKIILRECKLIMAKVTDVLP